MESGELQFKTFCKKVELANIKTVTVTVGCFIENNAALKSHCPYHKQLKKLPNNTVFHIFRAYIKLRSLYVGLVRKQEFHFMKNFKVSTFV